MAPNRRSVPTSLSLSDSSDPESWGSTTMNNNNVGGKVKLTIASGGVNNCDINGSATEHLNINSNSTGHYVNAKMLNFNHLNNSNVNNSNVNRRQINSSNNSGANDKINSCVNVSSSNQGISITSSTTITTTSSSLNVNHQNNPDHRPWKNWPKIDLISSIDPFESSDSMISAFACVAHVINSDSANEEEDQIDGDNEIIGITGDNCEHGNDDEDDGGSYDSSNHPNSLESPENYRPINKPQSVGYKSNNYINGKFNGKCSSYDRYTNKADQVNTIKPSPPPLSTIPRPSQQPPPPPISSSSPSSTTIVNTPTSSSTLVPNQIKSPTSKLTVTSTCSSSIATPITAKDHLYETIYPSNIRLTRDSKYFVDHHNYRSILSQPVEPVSSSLDLPVGHISIKVNQTNHTNDNNQSASIDLMNSKDMVRRTNYSSSAIAGKNSNKNVTVRLSSSTASQSYNQPRSIHYNQMQRSKPQAYNYHHPHHQHHLPGHSNSSSLYKPSLSSSSSSLMSPPQPSSPSPLPESNHNQGDKNQRLMKKLSENSSTNQDNNYHATAKLPNTVTISRPTYLQFNKLSNNLSYDEVDGKPNKSTIETKVNDNLSSTEKAKNLSNQVHQPNKLKPDQVYPNSISIPIISRANVRSTEEYATVNKARSLKSMKSATLTPSSPVNSYTNDIKLLSKDDSLLSSESKGKESIESPMSLTSLSSLSSPTTSPSTSSIGNNLIETKYKPGKTKSKDKATVSPLSQSTASPPSRSFFSRFFSLTHVISRTFSVEKIDKHNRSSNFHGKSTLIKSAVSTPALSSTTRTGFFTDLDVNNPTSNHFPSTRTLIDSPTGSSNNQENIEPVSLSSTSGSKSLQNKSSSSFVRAFKNRLSLRRSRRKVKVKVDVTRTKSDPRTSKSNRYEEDKMIPKQSTKEETIHGSIVATSGDYMKIVEIHRPQGKPFGFFVARGTVNNVKGIFISRIDSNGEKAYEGLLEIGDRLIEIDGNDVTEASVIQVNQLMSNKTKLTLKIVPFIVISDSSKA